MPVTTSRIAHLLAVVGTTAAFASAPIASADPSDLLPLCTGNQSPAEDNCRTPCPDGAPASPGATCGEPGTVDVTGGPADRPGVVGPGADPNVPVGTDPNVPVGTDFDEVFPGEAF
jgi:hypothetical protein